MEDTIYNLFLTGEHGWSLYGTLRLRSLAVDGDTSGSAALPALRSGSLQPVTLPVTLLPIEGELSIPLLTLFRQVPVRGVVYGTAAGSFSIAVDSGAAWPRLGWQIFPLDIEGYGGVLAWGSSTFSELLFGVLARQVPAQS